MIRYARDDRYGSALRRAITLLHELNLARAERRNDRAAEILRRVDRVTGFMRAWKASREAANRLDIAA